MNKLIKLNLQVKKQLRIDQVLKLNQLAKSYEGKIYLLTKSKNVIDAAKLPSLITYLLTVKNGQALNLIIDGPFPQLKLIDIEEVCSSTVIKQREQVLPHALKVKL
jgi:phosphotransferase system HPr-like phosphotransfer protein